MRTFPPCPCPSSPCPELHSLRWAGGSRRSLLALGKRVGRPSLASVSPAVHLSVCTTGLCGHVLLKRGAVNLLVT